jgi:hypothetical protein
MGEVIDIAQARRKRDEKLADEIRRAECVEELTKENLEQAIAKLRSWAEEIESGKLYIEITEEQNDEHNI